MLLPAYRQIRDLSPFISWAQRCALLTGAIHGEEREFFRDKIAEIHRRTQEMPRPYATDGQGKQSIAYLHYFLHGSDWYVVERDKGIAQRQAFGWASLNGADFEAGYISIQELVAHGAELDLYFDPRPVAECLQR